MKGKMKRMNMFNKLDINFLSSFGEDIFIKSPKLEREELVTESYIGNYFWNKVLLFKLGRNPEITRTNMLKLLNSLNKKYQKSLNTKVVKELMSKKDVGDYFIPQLDMTFPDEMTITFSFCYDKSSFTPGAAFKTPDKKYIVLLYPNFFDTTDVESQLFIILHEVGHIRLGHCELRNTHFDPDRRQRVMVHGGVVYPELNADLYAILNGAKMYAILNEAINDDVGNGYDYRYTNNEMAKRYSFVFKKYKWLKNMHEYVEPEEDFNHTIVESTDTISSGNIKITEEYGFEDDRGCYNSCVKVEGYDNNFRGRSEILVIKEDKVFLMFKHDSYKIPGGGWDKGEDHKDAAIRECKEECRIIPEEVQYFGPYLEVKENPPKWAAEKFPKEKLWTGKYTELYVGKYKIKYTGHIDDVDKDEIEEKGKFYKILEVFDQLKPEHQIAIKRYLPELFKKEYIKESITESFSESFDTFVSLLLESPQDSHIIRDEIYPSIEEVLKTPAGDKTFKRYVEDFINRNTDKLYEPCPISMIAFTDIDKARFFDLFNFQERDLVKTISKAVDTVSSTAQFRLIKQNPIFSVFYCVLRFYIIKNDQAGINTTLIIHALSSYPSVFSKYFEYGANAGIMKYTADHLTEKFIFKQEGHVLGALRKSIESSYKFLKPYFKEASDKEIIRYIQRIRNDQNSMIKKIKNEYQKNYEAGKSINTQTENYDSTGSLIDDYMNDTSKVETTSQKIIINLLTNGINLRVLETAAAMAQLSVSELRFYLVKILIESRSTELEDFITSVLFVYLYDEKHELHEIRSKLFLSFGIELFRRTNSNNKNIVTIKSLLDKWASETGINARYRREPTQIAYKKGIYWYILLSIQTNY